MKKISFKNVIGLVFLLSWGLFFILFMKTYYENKSLQNTIAQQNRLLKEIAQSDSIHLLNYKAYANAIKMYTTAHSIKVGKKEYTFEEFVKLYNQTEEDNYNLKISANVESALINKIKELQHQYVRDSWGTGSYQCFSDADLDEFEKSERTLQIARQLKADSGFHAIVSALRNKPPQDRTAILNNASIAYRKSWGTLAINPEDATKTELLKGQTYAGSTAERLIAETVVALLKESLKQ